MKSLQINFADKNNPWRWDSQRRGVQIFLVLILLTLCVLVLAWRDWQHLRSDLVHLEERRMQTQSDQVQMNGAVQALQQLGNDEVLLLRQSEYLRRLRWEAIFQAFEAVPGAGLDAFEPDLTHGIVRVQAHVVDVVTMQMYLRELQKSPVFLRVNLLRHEAQEARLNFQFEVVLAESYHMPDVQEKGTL